MKPMPVFLTGLILSASVAAQTLVADINSRPLAGAPSSTPSNIVEIEGVGCLFQATTAAEGAELWRTIGMGAGAVLVKDLLRGAQSSAPGRRSGRSATSG